MNIEHLKLILDTVNNAGEGAFTLGILWMLQGYFVPLTWLLGIVIFIVFVTKMFAPVLKHNAFANEARKVAGCRHPHGEITHGEHETVMEAIKKGRDL